MLLLYCKYTMNEHLITYWLWLRRGDFHGSLRAHCQSSSLPVHHQQRKVCDHYKLVHFAAVQLFLFSHRIQKNTHSPQPHLDLASYLSKHLSKTKAQIRMSARATSRRWTKTLVPLQHLYKVKIHRLYRKTQKVWGLEKVSLEVKYGGWWQIACRNCSKQTCKSHLTHNTALLATCGNKIISKKGKDQ